MRHVQLAARPVPMVQQARGQRVPGQLAQPVWAQEQAQVMVRAQALVLVPARFAAVPVLEAAVKA